MCSRLDFSKVKDEIQNFNPAVGRIICYAPVTVPTIFKDARGCPWEVATVQGMQVWARPVGSREPFQWFNVEIHDWE